MKRLDTVADVVAWRLCLGCGACAPICPQDRISLVDRVSEGWRPSVADGDCGDCTACLDVCPGLGCPVPAILPKGAEALPYAEGYGPVLEIWEGHAADPEIRAQGSSGGALTALALFCVESGGMQAAVHVGQDPDHPFRNRTFFSRTREELLSRTGSRYAPASACDSLRHIEAAAGRVAFIGQPLEVSALRKAELLRPGLKAKIGITLSFFCAGSPATLGTIELIRKHGVNPGTVSSIRYRGNGWPGHFRVAKRGEGEPAIKLTYKDSWAFVQSYRPLAVHLWPDGTGEDADIACGDPWYKAPKSGDIGSSLVVVRTARGRDLLQRAVAAGYLKLNRAEPWKLLKSQEGLIRKRGAIWGRLLAIRLLGLPVPQFPGRQLFSQWWRTPLREKILSTLGTLRRSLARGHWRPLNVKRILSTDQHLAEDENRLKSSTGQNARSDCSATA